MGVNGRCVVSPVHSYVKLVVVLRFLESSGGDPCDGVIFRDVSFAAIVRVRTSYGGS